VSFKGGYIDAWGRGTIKILDACREAGLPAPEMQERDGGFIVSLFKNNLADDVLIKLGLNSRQLKAVNFVKEKGKISNKEYQELFSVSRETASRDLADLTTKGVFINSGTKGAGSFFKLT
jgi:ATP-dependent DNA helicase RecG